APIYISMHLFSIVKDISKIKEELSELGAHFDNHPTDYIITEDKEISPGESDTHFSDPIRHQIQSEMRDLEEERLFSRFFCNGQNFNRSAIVIPSFPTKPLFKSQKSFHHKTVINNLEVTKTFAAAQSGEYQVISKSDNLTMYDILNLFGK